MQYEELVIKRFLKKIELGSDGDHFILFVAVGSQIDLIQDSMLGLRNDVEFQRLQPFMRVTISTYDFTKKRRLVVRVVSNELSLRGLRATGIDTNLFWSHPDAYKLTSDPVMHQQILFLEFRIILLK